MELERQGKLEAAEDLLLKIVKAHEEESAATGRGVVPGGYERLAIIYRKQQRHEDEIAILERFASQKHAPGATPPKLLKRLAKARRSFGDPPPAEVSGPTPEEVAAMARSPLGSADKFLHAIRTARHYDGSLVVESDAPLRTRGETPSYIEVVAPRPIPAYEGRIIQRDSLNSGVPVLRIEIRTEGQREAANPELPPELNQDQAAFYEAWRTEFEAGKVWQAPKRRKERSLTAFGYQYARDLIAEARSDPGTAAIYLERLAQAYPGLRDHVAPWARDAWVLAGDLKGAIDCLPPPRPPGVSGLLTDLRLTLKHLLGMQLDARELFGLYPPKLTPAVRDHLDDLVTIVQSRLDAEHRSGANYLDELFLDRSLELMGWPLWNASFNVVVIEAAPVGRLSKLEAGEELAANLQRAAENALREDMGLPQVGQGWVSETQLFVELRDALDTEVVQHGVPDGFGQQHLDVWIPAWRIGVEYQGPQHFGPVEFFGGEEAFRRTLKRDEQKRAKAKRLKIRLIYVEPGYELNEVVAQIRGARASA